jgi:hypothetical protein
MIAPGALDLLKQRLSMLEIHALVISAGHASVRIVRANVSSLFWIGLGAFCFACHGDTEFDAKQANDFSPAGRISVSVLGVFKDGYMSPETWETLGPRLSPVMREAKCETGYDAAFVAKNKEAASAIDDYTRANGVTEPLLAELSQSAEGDVLMIVTVSGHALQDKSYRHDPGPPMPGLASAPGRQGGGTGNGFSGGTGNSAAQSPWFGKTSPANAANDGSGSMYEISATFYSVSLKRPVAALSMKYTGPREDDAVTRFVDKLRGFAPNATCVGFRRDVKIEEDRVRALPTGE